MRPDRSRTSAVAGANPIRRTDTVASPVGRLIIRNPPESLVCTDRKSVPLYRTSTAGIATPLESRTTPTSAAGSNWALAEVSGAAHTSASANSLVWTLAFPAMIRPLAPLAPWAEELSC